MQITTFCRIHNCRIFEFLNFTGSGSYSIITWTIKSCFRMTGKNSLSYRSGITLFFHNSSHNIPDLPLLIWTVWTVLHHKQAASLWKAWLSVSKARLHVLKQMLGRFFWLTDTLRIFENLVCKLQRFIHLLKALNS